MMWNPRFFLMITSAFVTASCGTYQNPKGEPQSLARIRNHDKSQPWNPTIFGNEEHVMVYAIDGKRVSYDFTWTTGTAKILLTPGSHKIELIVSSRKNTIYRRSVVNVVVNVQAGRTYLLKGEYHDTDARIWIEEDGTGRKIIPPRNVEILAVPPNNQAPMIIFLPS